MLPAQAFLRSEKSSDGSGALIAPGDGALGPNTRAEPATP